MGGACLENIRLKGCMNLMVAVFYKEAPPGPPQVQSLKHFQFYVFVVFVPFLWGAIDCGDAASG